MHGDMKLIFRPVKESLTKGLMELANKNFNERNKNYLLL